MKPDMLKGALKAHFTKGYEEGYNAGFQRGFHDGTCQTVKNYSAVTLLCLKDHFDFTKEQLTEIAGHINNYFDSVCEGYVTLDDVLNTLEEPERWSTYFMKIDDVKFRKKVVPGDTLLFKVELLAPLRHGISSMKGYVFVGDHVVSEATFTAQIVKNK